MMPKLCLYSEQLSCDARRIDQLLLELIGKPRARIGFIPSAAAPGDAFYYSQREYYARLGAKLSPCVNLDQRFVPQRIDELLQCDAIHLSGGNTHHSLFWLRRRGLTALLLDYVERGGVLIGVSAGAIVMTPEIASCQLCGDERDIDLSDLCGLALTDFGFAPHFGRAFDLAALQTFSRDREPERIVYGCPDGAGIVIDGDRVQLVGDVVAVKAGVVQ